VPAILSALDTAGLTATARPQQVDPSAPTSLSLRMLALPIAASLSREVSVGSHDLPHPTLLLTMVWCGSQVVQLSEFRRATPTEVFAVHREHYVEQLRSVVASKAPAMVETAPTYVTSSSFDDALGVRHMPLVPPCFCLPSAISSQTPHFDCRLSVPRWPSSMLFVRQLQLATARCQLASASAGRRAITQYPR